MNGYQIRAQEPFKHKILKRITDKIKIYNQHAKGNKVIYKI